MKQPTTTQFITAALLMASLGLTACKEEKMEPSTPTVADDKKLYFVNEGNFSSGNGSIGLYQKEKNAQPLYIADLFQPANNVALGSVVQSLTFHKGKGYITVQGNTGKIEVVDSATLVRQTTITSISAPQYLEPVSATKAYVTSWDFASAENEVAVLDLNTNAEVSRIKVKATPTQLLKVGNEMWVAYAPFTNSNQLTVLNTQTDAVAAHVTLPVDAQNRFTSPSAMALDANNKLWVLCAGVNDYMDSTNNTAGALLKLDPATRQVLASFPFSSNTTHPRHLALSPDGMQLYYEYMGSVYKMATTATALPAAPLFNPQAGNFYGLSVSPSSGNIYVADGSFTSNSRVLVYKPSGVSQGEITTGVGTNRVVFK